MFSGRASPWTDLAHDMGVGCSLEEQAAEGLASRAGHTCFETMSLGCVAAVLQECLAGCVRAN